MPRNRLTRLIKNVHPKRQKGPRKTFEETYGRVRPERADKWPIPWLLHDYYYDDDDSVFFVLNCTKCNVRG
jgi:hypothetical protein